MSFCISFGDRGTALRGAATCNHLHLAPTTVAQPSGLRSAVKHAGRGIDWFINALPSGNIQRLLLENAFSYQRSIPFLATLFASQLQAFKSGVSGCGRFSSDSCLELL